MDATIAVVDLQAAPQIDVTFVPKLNLADCQHGSPVLRELAVRSNTDLGDLALTVVAEPPFLHSKTWRIDAMSAGDTCRPHNLDLLLDAGLLGRLTEARPATVRFALHQRDNPAQVLASRELTVELLPQNQWGGLASSPEMIAAFVQPNDAAVERVLKRAAEILRQAGQSGAINGYQAGATGAWTLAQAIWVALGGLGLDYAQPPASFEHRGQKIRNPSRVVEAGLATCLDATLLYCAALEQAGLSGLVVFIEGHALAGVWLQNETFGHAVVDDVMALRKRVRLGELILLDPVLLTQRPVPSFRQASDSGEAAIAEVREQAFELAVDIRRARLQGIKPLDSHQVQLALAPSVAAGTVEPLFEPAPDLPSYSLHPTPNRPEDRLTRWQRKLLDLSLRNNLLSFRAGKKSLPLDAPDPGRLEDLLAGGQSLKLLSRPVAMTVVDPAVESRDRETLRHALALDALARKEVFVALDSEALEARLVELYRSARTGLQENGANTLYLALGFLAWTQDARSEKRHKAPLILVPVTLERKSVRSGFALRLHDEEPRFNPTLIEMLRQDFRLQLGIDDSELPKDEQGLDVAGIWRRVAAAVRDIKGWEVVEEVVLSTFSFAKYLMWKDLTGRTEQLKQNAVVRHLIESPREPYPSEIAFPDPRRLDEELPPERDFCLLPADSSQLRAVVAAARGKDFVLIGPPGTGKSQTIANLIAQCLAEGKRVLFVSEKMAALDVVYRRLRDVGLGDCCLELHSNKARKTEVLAQLKRAWDAAASHDPAQWRREAERLGRLRAELNHYVEHLHRRLPNGLSVYQAIGQVVAGSAMAELPLRWSDPLLHDDVALAGLRELAQRLGVAAQSLDADRPGASCFAAMPRRGWSHAWQTELAQLLRQLVSAAEASETAAHTLREVLELPQIEGNGRTRKALGLLARALPQPAGRDWRFAVRPHAGEVAQGLQRCLTQLVRYRELRSQLSMPWRAETLQTLRDGLQRLGRFRALQASLVPAWSKAMLDELRHGLMLLQRAAGLTAKLSLPYPLSELDFSSLQHEWQAVQGAPWPINWFRRRALVQRLQTLAGSQAQPDLSGDMACLTELAAVRAELAKLDGLTARTGRIWAGQNTRLDLLQAVLSLQDAVQAARDGLPWREDGWESIAAGEVGSGMAESLSQLRELRRLDAGLAELTLLGADTDGVWAGHATQLDIAMAALRWQTALASVLSGRPWQDQGLGPVEAGRCGERAATDLALLREMAELASMLALMPHSPGLWEGLDTEVAVVEAALNFQKAVATALPHLAPMLAEQSRVLDRLEQLYGEETAGLAAAIQAGQAYLTGLRSLQQTLPQLCQEAGFIAQEQAALAEATPVELAERGRRLLQHLGKLAAWCAWNEVREEASAQGLAPLVAALEDGTVAAAAAEQAFEVNYCRWWLTATIDADPTLRGFVASTHEQRIRDFRELDARLARLTRDWVRARLHAGLPAQDAVTRQSEWGRLRYEMQKKTRHMPLRELMSQTGTAVTTLTPCLLMSPLSVAQYLSAGTATFDLVVFDEASQIPVWDAIGAIARARQVVMVGDPKQLPPTSFFDRAEVEDEDSEIEADLESILDECLGANLPTIDLSWHYRSRHESLIAFSNHRYYQGGLVTFPSPVTEDKAVSFHRIEGLYDKGGSRTNLIEARALVADLVGKLKSPDFAGSAMSIGVVTFNGEQQRLIEDLLDEERRRDPALESYFSDSLLEPVFVKNLESVQGDERDIVYFSLTYGPTASGTVSMNFGPMNKQGGERRLNVAITRARHALKVFSSLGPEQLDLSRTQAAGVRDLKHFMEFAERGSRALGEAVHGSVGSYDSPFEQQVALALMARGWQVHPQVGVSSFRIDLGIVDPDAPGRYLAGVECDGATYHRSATARDRDKLREQVLNGLGWTLVRVWSTDWWLDPQACADKIAARLEALLAQRRVNQSEAPAHIELAKPASEAIKVTLPLGEPVVYGREGGSVNAGTAERK
ncbi:DUF4011 domain-containing protein [Chitinimonas lacunae]|uniref:DUF4011 domain-containing protein n=1 Tax=Chitinimonas lacunae TaxID=1963018 RepID=A0ABV8MNW3_9NEIS